MKIFAHMEQPTPMETEAAAAPTSAMDTDEQMAAEAKALVAAAIDAAIDAAHRAACIIVRAPAHSRMHRSKVQPRPCRFRQ